MKPCCIHSFCAFLYWTVCLWYPSTLLHASLLYNIHCINTPYLFILLLIIIWVVFRLGLLFVISRWYCWFIDSAHLPLVKIMINRLPKPAHIPSISVWVPVTSFLHYHLIVNWIVNLINNLLLDQHSTWLLNLMGEIEPTAEYTKQVFADSWLFHTFNKTDNLVQEFIACA